MESWSAELLELFADELLQGFEERRHLGQMYGSSAAFNQSKSRAIRRSVRHARIRETLGNLLFCQSEHAVTVAFHLEFPAHQARLGKPAPQFTGDLRRRQ